MNTVEQILKSEKKPKEKVSFLAQRIKKDKALFKELINALKNGSDVEKGTCADVMKYVTENRPDIAVPYIDEIIGYINYKASRVKWGIPESIGNIAKKYPNKVEKAVPKLLVNIKDESTVIRWCAAFGLTEIAKNNPRQAKKLIPKMKGLVKKEKNNGVKNVYLRALKILEKK